MSKITELKLMNEIMQQFNNEEAYYTWIMFVPDGATREDFEDIADDEEFFDEVVSLFKSLYKRYHNDGIIANSNEDMLTYCQTMDYKLGLQPIEIIEL